MATPNTPAFITQIVDQCIDYTGDIFDRGITVDPTPQLSGRAPANSPVYIYDGGKLIGSAKADGSGNWSFTPDRELGTGLHALTVMAHGKMSEPLIITVEASGASTGRPVITSVVDNQGDSGQVEHGATISDKSPTLSGTAAPNAYVEIFSSGRSVGVVQANAEGHWSITPTLSEGLNILSVKSQGQYSEIFTLNIETATTVKPTIENVYDNLGESGLVGEGAITDDNTPTVSGNARPGAIVQLYANGREVGRTQADSNGNWSITTSALENGQQVLKVASEGQFSDGFTINVEAFITPPLSIQSVYDNQGTSGLVGEGAITDDNTPTVSGNARPGAIVQLYANGREVGRTQADSNGNWSITTSALENGQQVLKVASEGQFSDGFTINVEAFTTPPLSIQSVYDNQGTSGLVGEGAITDDNTPTVSGNARPGAIVQLYANGREVGRTQADSNGNWSITTSALENGQQVLKVASEGQFSDGFTINVEAFTTPPLSIQSVYDNQGSSGLVGEGAITDDNTPTVSGNARPGAIVQLYANGREVGRTQADSNGNWSITTSALENGQQVLKVASEGQFSDSYIIDVQVPAEVGEPIRPAIEYVYDDFGSDVGQRYSGDTIDDRSPVLAGTAGPHAIVQIYSNGQLIHTLQANDTGYWGFTAWLPYGEHTLTAVVGGVSSEPFDLTIVDPLQEPVADEYSHALSLDNVLADSHLDVFGETVAPVAELDPVQTLRLMDAFLSEAGHAPSGNVAGFTCMAFTPELLLPVEELLQPPL